MAKRGELVVVARGGDWLLAWPRAEWEKLTPDEQQDVIARQTALMSQNETENRTRRPVVGVSNSLALSESEPSGQSRTRGRRFQQGGYGI